MSANLARALWLSVVAFGFAAAPAMAQTAKPVATHHHATHAATHHATHGKSAKGSKGYASHESSTDQLNAQSLSAARQGQSFAPGGSAAPAAPAAPAEAPK